ncbi:hypothetical protein LTS18_009955, partial [Coniosporium uncinatum]
GAQDVQQLGYVTYEVHMRVAANKTQMFVWVAGQFEKYGRLAPRSVRLLSRAVEEALGKRTGKLDGLDLVVVLKKLWLFDFTYVQHEERALWVRERWDGEGEVDESLYGLPIYGFDSTEDGQFERIVGG